MSKITKRVLSIILALVLAVSGVLSGIPGGGIARAEEWDVGAEIVGEDAPLDPNVFGEVAPEEETISVQEEETAVQETENAPEEGNAGVQEVVLAEGQVEGVEGQVEEPVEEGAVEEPVDTGSSSAVFEEEAAVFGEYDPSSTAEASFNESASSEQEIADLVDEEGESFIFEEGASYIEEEANGEGYSDEEVGEGIAEIGNRTRGEGLAGDGETKDIYFIPYSGWGTSTNTVYWIWSWPSGGGGSSSAATLESYQIDSKDVYKATIPANHNLLKIVRSQAIGDWTNSKSETGDLGYVDDGRLFVMTSDSGTVHPAYGFDSTTGTILKRRIYFSTENVNGEKYGWAKNKSVFCKPFL